MDERELIREARNASKARLMIMHNLTVKNLRFSLDHMNGYLAAPSVMMLDPWVFDGNNSFGSISLIMDPKKFDYGSRGDVVIYDRDIYSSRFPGIKWTVDHKGLQEVLDAIREKYPETERMNGFSWDRAEKEGIDAIYWCEEVRYLYLREIEGVPMRIDRLKASDSSKRTYELAAKYGFADVRQHYALHNVPQEKLKAFMLDYNVAFMEGISEEHQDLFAKSYPTDPDAIEINLGHHFWGSVLRDLEMVRREGEKRPDVSAILDRAKKRFNSSVDKRYRIWVAKTFRRFIGDPRYYTGKRNANGRPVFRDVDVDSLASHMSGRQRNKEGTIYGLPSLAAHQAKSIPYLEDARKLAGSRLVSQEEFDEWKDKKEGELQDLISSFDPYCAYSSGGGTAFVECLIGKDRWSSAYPGADQSMISEARSFLASVRGAPTTYFEMKYNKAIPIKNRGYEGFAAALVPKHSLEEVGGDLERVGIRVIPYSGSIGPRLRGLREYQLT